MSWIARQIERLLPASVREDRTERRIAEHFAEAVSTARAAKQLDEVQRLEWEYRHELQMVREEREERYTRKLVRVAHRLHIPTPAWRLDGKETGFWERSTITGSTFLTPAGLAKLREDLRVEVRWRQEQRAHWTQLIGTLTGLVGAAAALAAVLFAV